jgi:hypothetical protein
MTNETGAPELFPRESFFDLAREIMADPRAFVAEELAQSIEDDANNLNAK